MGGLGSALVVAAIAVLALVAAVDSLIGSDPPPAAETAAGTEEAVEPEPEERSPLEEELYLAGLRGTLWVSGPTCELSALTFPELPPRRAAARSCRLAVAGDLRLEVDKRALQPDGTLIARCGVQRIELVDAGDPSSEPATFAGCAPAWTPDGTLTYVLLGEVVSRDGDGGVRTVLSKATLAKALHDAPGVDPVIASFSVRELAWLTNRRLAAVVRGYWPRGTGTADYFVLLERGRLVGRPAAAGRDIRYLHVSPRRSFASAYVVGQGLHVLDRSGESLRVPVRGAESIAWSPDEGWTAIGGPGGVVVFPTSRPEGQRLRLPVAARDLAWVA
jgi:hypothetical protein